MHRFFVAPNDGQRLADGAEIALPTEEARHAAQVLRLTAGESVELLDGESLYAGEMLHIEGQHASVRVLHRIEGREPRVHITLYQALAKGEKMEGIIQKCTELGVFAVQPLALARCVQRMDEKRAQTAQARWQRVAREAAKQCGRACVPQVFAPQTLAQLLPSMAATRPLIVPWEEARAGGLAEVLPTISQKDGETPHIGLVIGPEGGITREEIDTLLRINGQTITLGPRILRTETAGPAVIAAIMALTGGWA